MVENFPNMEKKIVNRVQEAQRVPYRINAKINTPTFEFKASQKKSKRKGMRKFLKRL